LSTTTTDVAMIVFHILCAHTPGASPTQVITRVASTRVAEYAFKYATDNKRQKVSALHKANIMKKADGLFIECCREVAGETGAGLCCWVMIELGTACAP
jgi:isocitrate dehydrogenase